MRVKKYHQKISEDIIGLLAAIVGRKNVLTGDERQNYSRDELFRGRPIVPDVVVRPEDTASVARILKLANERKIPIVPRGGGTGLSGGAVAFYGGIVLSLERMNKILEIDEDNFIATVESGATLAELYQAVEERGLYYPLYPGETGATLGGNIATNAGGMRAVKYGVTRHFVLGLEAVLPSGEIIHTGGKFIKCSSGYDLTQLMVGSEGTLAVITKIMLKLISMPGKREIICIPFSNLHDAIKAVPAILKTGTLPVGIEWMERDIIERVEQYTGKKIPLHGYEVFLMIILEATNEDEFLNISNRIGEVCLKHGAADIFIPGSEKAERNLLEAREKFGPAVHHCEEVLETADIVVPRGAIAEFIERARDTAVKYGMTILAFGHAGDGNLHVFCAASKGTHPGQENVRNLLLEIYKLGVSLGGTISGEHGLGYSKKEFFPMAAEENEIGLMKRIKKAFDPNNIMNPGKIFDY